MDFVGTFACWCYFKIFRLHVNFTFKLRSLCSLALQWACPAFLIITQQASTGLLASPVLSDLILCSVISSSHHLEFVYYGCINIFTKRICISGLFLQVPVCSTCFTTAFVTISYSIIRWHSLNTKRINTWYLECVSWFVEEGWFVVWNINKLDCSSILHVVQLRVQVVFLFLEPLLVHILCHFGALPLIIFVLLLNDGFPSISASVNSRY